MFILVTGFGATSASAQAVSVCTPTSTLTAFDFDDGTDEGWTSTQAANAPIGGGAATNNIGNQDGTVTDVTVTADLNGGAGVPSPSGGLFVGAYDFSSNAPFWSSPNLGADLSSALGGAIRYELFDWRDGINASRVQQGPQDFAIVGPAGRLVLDIPQSDYEAAVLAGEWFTIERLLEPSAEWTFVPSTNLTSFVGQRAAVEQDFIDVLANVSNLVIRPEYVNGGNGPAGTADTYERFAIDGVQIVACEEPPEIIAEDDVVEDPIDASADANGVANVLDDNGSGVDTLDDDPATASIVTVSPDPLGDPVPAGLTLNPDGTVDVAAGTAPGVYEIDYQICEIAEPDNCDPATLTLTIGEAGIGLVKDAVFVDENGDGNAQVGETITYTYTVTNEGDFDLSEVAIAETGFTGNGPTPMPEFQSGDDGDDILQTTETWIYEVDYSLVAEDIADGEVLNQATVAGESPAGGSVTDDSDSTNAADGNGVGTPGGGTDNDDPNVTPLTPAPIDAQDDTLADSVDATTIQIGVLNVFDDNGSGFDSLSGDPTDATEVEVAIVPTDPPPAGFTLNPDGSVDVAAGTPPGEYSFPYEICEIANPDNCDTATVTITIAAIEAIAETFDVINGETGGTTDSVLTSDTLNGAPITDPTQVTITVDSATGGLTLDPMTNGIIVPPGTPDGSYTLTYTICDALNPAICSTVTETVVVGEIVAIAETFDIISEDGGTTTGSVLDSDLLNGEPASLSTVSLDLISSDPELTLNPDGTVTVAPGTPIGTYVLTYEICDLSEPAICDTVEETVTMGVVGGIETLKTQTLVDNGDGIDGAGDTLDYTITVTNTSNTDLSDVTLNDTLTDGLGNVLALTTGPDFDSASSGSAEGDLLIGEVATYTSSYLLQDGDVATGLVSNTVFAEAQPVAPPGYAGPPLPLVGDISDEGNPTNGVDDPTVFPFTPDTFLDGLSIIKTAGVSTVSRGGTVPYVITVTNDNPTIGVSAITVDSLPPGFVYEPGSASVDGVATTPVVTSGRVISFPTVIIPPGGTSEITLSARVLTSAEAGDQVNQADILDSVSGSRLSPTATATVRIEPEPVFDCGDVIGKVYDDLNHNGYQDQDEPGLPSVRIAGVDGTIITTDQFGRFHVPCAALPATRGTNFILKLDESSLPTGYRVTTENPRVIRLTRGKMSELNFGASITRVVRVDINSRAFMLNDAGKLDLTPAFAKGVDGLLQRIKPMPSTVRLAFHLPDDASAAQKRTARKMLRDVRRHMKRRWRDIGDYKLNIETTFVRRQ